MVGGVLKEFYTKGYVVRNKKVKLSKISHRKNSISEHSAEL